MRHIAMAIIACSLLGGVPAVFAQAITESPINGSSAGPAQVPEPQNAPGRTAALSREVDREECLSERWDAMARDWPRLRALVGTRWSELRDDDIAHRLTQLELISIVQLRYGVAYPEAARQVSSWAAGVPVD